MNIIDFHSHILPGIDDGSKDREMTVEMLNLMKSQGVNTVVATPHFYADKTGIDEFIKNRDEAYNTIKDVYDDIKIKVGAEVAFFDGISKTNRIKELCINDTNVLLVEMPFEKWKDYQIEEIYTLARKYNVVLAHVERYVRFGNVSWIKKLIDTDVIFQINCGFINSGKQKRLVKKIIKKNCPVVLGSDAHGTETRKPNLREGIENIEAIAGSEYLERIVVYANELLK